MAIDWEREGSVSYFEDGQAAVCVGRGRAHSRWQQPDQRAAAGVSPVFPSESTGRASFRRACSSARTAQPIRRLVIHDDVRRERRSVDWHFVNPLAYDIARAVGAVAPETKPVRFFLNGEYYGPFVLTERFDERYFAAHWGYDDVLLSQEEMDKLWEWVRTTRPLTMENGRASMSTSTTSRDGSWPWRSVRRAMRIRGRDSSSTRRRDRAAGSG